MEKVEFNLSEKIEGESYGYRKDMIEVGDVREFINGVKNGWAATKEMPIKLFKQLQVQIDNLAGEKLV